VHEGYVTRVDHCYALGDRILALAESGSRAARGSRFRPVRREAHGAPAYLAEMDDGEVRLVEVVDSGGAQRVDQWVGFHDAALATALGKSIPAHLTPESRRDYLARHDLPDLTAHTITDARVLEQNLCAAADVAVDREEYALGTGCVAVAVPSTRTTASVAVSVPVARLDREPDLVPALRRAARLIAYGLEDAG